MSNRITQTLAGRKTAMALFLLLAATLAADTVFFRKQGGISVFSGAALALLAANITLCTWQQRNRLPLDIIFIHAGFIVIAAGCLLGATGFVATVNIHEGSGTDTAFFWDTGQDKPLGFTLYLKAIHRKPYPAPVKIGIIEYGRKTRLVTTHTGARFNHEGYGIEVLRLDADRESLQLLITGKDGKKRRYRTVKDTAGVPGDSPLECVLVSYRTPAEKEVWVDIEIVEKNGTTQRGSSRVNAPFAARGLRFYHTATGRGRDGRPFAGIQIVRDPGVPMVYGGFLLMTAGCLLLLKRRV